MGSELVMRAHSSLRTSEGTLETPGCRKLFHFLKPRPLCMCLAGYWVSTSPRWRGGNVATGSARVLVRTHPNAVSPAGLAGGDRLGTGPVLGT